MLDGGVLRVRAHCRDLILATVVVLMTPSAIAAESPRLQAVAEFLSNDSSSIEQLVADLASDRLEFLDLAYVDPDDQDGDGGWLLAYKKSWNDGHKSVGLDAGRFVMRATSYQLDVNGSYATRGATNNQDLSTITAKLSFQRGDWGELKVLTNETAAPFKQCLGSLPPDPPGSASKQEQSEFRAQEDACWTKYGIDNVVRDRDTAYLWNFDFHAGIEANQDYTETHGLFGISLLGAISPQLQASSYNLPDLPFRWLRNAFTENSGYVAPFPSVRLTLERVDAADDQMRRELTDEVEYTRASAELSFQTQLPSIHGTPMRFGAAYRYFHEIDAPSSISDAGLERYDYFSASIHLPARFVPILENTEYELFLRFTSGQLPFDQQSGQTVQLGFTTNFEPLAKLLAD